MTDQPAAPYTPPAPVGAPPDLSIIKIPILISAIFNVLIALAWLPFCVTIVISIPLIALAVFEFMLFTKLNAPDVDPPSLKGRTQIIAILEICTILVGSVPNLICGILVLVNLNKMDAPQA
ncbi:MAG: hypothetical protein DHS20C14_22330 [Phycisphaeraceae bacterium]|nr:MAG: hypothetical protein DHS20C14_22330 [Phycisphaeraceae bacterium]